MADLSLLAVVLGGRFTQTNAEHIISKRFSAQEGSPHDLLLLTLYRPNFCSACGAKIIRLRWFLWTSRRVCDSCGPQFRKEQWLQPLLVVISLLVVGFLFGRALRPTPPPLLIQRSTPATTLSGVTSVAPVVTDEVYLCGARTKKGTPCSRRVHGPVRCWQHKGAKEMLPQEKLLVKE